MDAGMYANLPRTSAYLAALPAGLDSYPAATVKGSVVRAMIDRSPEVLRSAKLAPELERLYTEPPLVSDWVPEVHLATMAMLARDIAYESEADFLAFVHSGIAQVLSSPLYRIVFSLLSPSRLARSGTKRWGALIRGTRRFLLELNENGNLGEIRFSPNLYTEAHCRSILEALMVAYGMSRAPDPQGRLVQWEPTFARLEIVYDRSRPRGAIL